MCSNSRQGKGSDRAGVPRRPTCVSHQPPPHRRRHHPRAHPPPPPAATAHLRAPSVALPSVRGLGDVRGVEAADLVP